MPLPPLPQPHTWAQGGTPYTTATVTMGVDLRLLLHSPVVLQRKSNIKDWPMRKSELNFGALWYPIPNFQDVNVIRHHTCDYVRLHGTCQGIV